MSRVSRRTLRLFLITGILLFGVLPAANFAGQLLGLGPSLGLDVRPVAAVGPVVVGFDCALGTMEAGLDGNGLPTVGDGNLNTTCTWSGDTDGDGNSDPLVSDPTPNFELGGNVAPFIGGGFTVEVRATGLASVSPSVNGYDITFVYDPRYLDAALIDQTGLAPWDTAFSLARIVDRTTGTIRVAQVLLGTSVNVDSTLFRVRFDVVGVSVSSLTISPSVLTNPGAVAHKTQSASFDSSVASGSLFEVFWTFTPSPEVPGSTLTLAATASCPSCGPLTFGWDTNSDGSLDATGSSATLDPPHPIINRVELMVGDGVNSAKAVRILPLTAIVTGPTTFAVNTPQTWSAFWLGGVSPYSGTWRFCPGSGINANVVCARPAPPIPSTTTQSNSQTLSAGTGPGAYHFAGIYTNTMTIRESTPSWIDPSVDVSVVVTFLVEVTGTPAAYTVGLNNVAKAFVGDTVSITATIAYASTYPTTVGFRSSFFDVFFEWGDGTVGTFSGGVQGCETTSCTVSGSHVYQNPGSYSIRATAKETEAGTAISKIQEVGSSSIQINPLGEPLTATLTLDTATPTAGKPASFTATATGGTGPYTFTLAYGDGMSDTVTGTSPQTFSHSYAVKGPYNAILTVTDSAVPQATDTDQVAVTVSSQPLVVTVVCADGTAGKPISCDVSASGGTPPYSGTGTFERTFATKGTYDVSFTVTDANGASATGSDSVVISSQPLVVTVACADGTAGKPISCDVSASGGTSPYSGTGTFSRTFATKGTYTVSFDVTDTNGVTATGSDTVVIGPQPLVVTVACPDSGLTAGKPFNCDVSASGGTSPYVGTGTQVVVFPVKGTYTVSFTVTDANLATATGSDTVTIAPQPLVVTVACPDSGLVAGVPFTCDVSATGGTAPYSGTGSMTVSFPVKGPYTVSFTVTDANGASATGSDNVVISADQPPVATVVCPDSGLTAGKPFTCDVSATGGTAPYVGTGPQSVVFPTKGTYTVSFTITDANGATATGSDTVVIAPQPLLVSVLCSDGTAGKPITCTVSALGGTAPYSGTGTFERTFATKGTYDVSFTVTDANGDSTSGSDSVVISPQPLITTVACPDSGLVAGTAFTCDVSATGGTLPYTGTGPQSVVFAVKGTYTVSFTVTDANGDSDTGGDIVVISPDQPLSATVVCPDSGLTAGKPFSCDVSATGGTAPYTGTGPQSVVFPVKGTYTVSFTVTDANGDTASGSDTVTIDPQTLMITGITVTPPSPTVNQEASLEATVTGGTGPYAVAWDFGDSTTGTGNPTTHTYTVPDTYTVTATATDSNGATATFSMNVVVQEQVIPPTVDFAPTQTLVGTTDFVGLISGGLPPYACTWTFGDNTPSQTGCKTSHSYTTAGQFSVTLSVTDARGATASKTSTVTVEAGPTLIRGRMSWKHHLNWDTVQNFIAKARNPSSLSADVQLRVVIDDADGMNVATIFSPVVTLASGATNLAITATWDPTNVAEKYSITGTLIYSHNFGDLDGDGVDEMVTGIDGSKSGSFAVVSP